MWSQYLNQSPEKSIVQANYQRQLTAQDDLVDSQSPAQMTKAVSEFGEFISQRQHELHELKKAKTRLGDELNIKVIINIAL
jgi:hypothetical protein